MAWWGVVVRIALESIMTFGNTFFQAWHIVSRPTTIGLTAGKKMTRQEALKILGLNSVTPRLIQERYKKLIEANSKEEGSLYLRHKVEIAKRTLEGQVRPGRR